MIKPFIVGVVSIFVLAHAVQAEAQSLKFTGLTNGTNIPFTVTYGQDTLLTSQSTFTAQYSFDEFGRSEFIQNQIDIVRPSPIITLNGQTLGRVNAVPVAQASYQNALERFGQNPDAISGSIFVDGNEYRDGLFFSSLADFSNPIRGQNFIGVYFDTQVIHHTTHILASQYTNNFVLVNADGTTTTESVSRETYFDLLLDADPQYMSFTKVSSGTKYAYNFMPQLGDVNAVNYRDSLSGLAFSGVITRMEVDQFSGGAIPEPTSWAMLIAGFGLIGASMRRQRQVVAAI